MTETLIDSQNTFAILTICLVIAFISIRLEKTLIGRRVSGAMVAIILAALLSNMKILPSTSPAFEFIWLYLVPLAIALFLIRADMITILKDGGRTLLAFSFGALGTIVGSLLGPILLDVGPHDTEYAAIFAATFTGGALNFAAVADAISFRMPTELAAAIAVDNVLGLSYLILLGAVAQWATVQKWLPVGADQDELKKDDARTPPRTGLGDLVLALAIAAGACTIGKYIANLFGHDNYFILYITFVMVAVATVARRWLEHLECAELMAMMFMYLFFVMLGTGADVSAMFASTISLFLFVALIIATHLLFTLAGARLFQINYREAIIASSACIGGPPIAVAIAVLFGWRNLVTAGVIAGVLGYAVGSFIGIGVYAALQG